MCTKREDDGPPEEVESRLVRQFREVDANDQDGLDRVLREMTIHFRDSVIRRLIHKFGGALNREDCEEFLQDAFLALWEEKCKNELDWEKLRLDSWLFRVAHNCAVDEWRRNERWANAENERRDQVPAVLIPEDEQEAPKPVLQALLQALSEVVSCLSEEDRDILYAYRDRSISNGRWTEEVAPKLGMTPNNVRVRLVRIIRRIREEMSERGYPDLETFFQQLSKPRR